MPNGHSTLQAGQCLGEKSSSDTRITVQPCAPPVGFQENLNPARFLDSPIVTLSFSFHRFAISLSYERAAMLLCSQQSPNLTFQRLIKTGGFDVPDILKRYKHCTLDLSKKCWFHRNRTNCRYSPENLQHSPAMGKHQPQLRAQTRVQ